MGVHVIYLALLYLCAAAAGTVLVYRCLRLTRARPNFGRAVNEIIWTAVPIAVLLFLLWEASRHA